MKNFGESVLRLAFAMICVGLLTLLVWCLPLDRAPMIPLIGSLGLMAFGIIFIGIRVVLGQDHCGHCVCEECRVEAEEPPKGSS